MEQQTTLRVLLSKDMRLPWAIASVQLIIQMIFHGNYGYFRDELYYIACSNHLAWGYVDAPPLSAFVLAVWRMVFGDSLHAIRFLPALSISGVVIIAALMTRKLGGKQFAQGLASLGVVAAHVLLGNGRYFSMNAFDDLFWALALYIVIRILVDDKPRLWPWFGATIGLGLLNKYSVGFMCVGLLAGLLLTSQRKQLATKWFWIGVFIAFLLVVPHIIWEIKNGLPSFEFMRNASQQKNVPTSFSEFLFGQFREVNFFNAPIWLLGVYYFFFHKEGKQFRFLGWMYVVVFAIFVAGNGKAYYLSPIYSVMLAGGSVFVEQLSPGKMGNVLRPVYVGLLIALTIMVLPLAVPVLPVDKFIEYEKILGLTPKAEERTSLGALPQGYADEFGWEEFTATVARIYQTLTPEEQAKCVIYVRNYGEAGAIDFFGKKYGLPGALCAHNSYWYWGPGEKSGDIAIILGSQRDLQENLDDLRRAYKSVEPSLKTDCSLCMPYENGRQFFVCRGMNTTFQKIWPNERFVI